MVGKSIAKKLRKVTYYIRNKRINRKDFSFFMKFVR